MTSKTGKYLKAGLTCLLLIAFAAIGFASQDKSGVKPQVISLPTGPGSIEGMGESFEPQLNTGSATYSVKFFLPPGVNGHQPELALQYSSGFGNGPFGIGWDLPLPHIQRQTDKGQPAYQNGDVFIYSNGEELVPLADGTWRCENETAFMRFKRDGDGWEVRDKSGRIYLLGQYPSEEKPWQTSRIGKNDTGFDQTFKWYVNTFIDTNGNRIEYFYNTFADSPGQLYITEIRYNINGGIYNSVTFDYEERPDPFSDYRAGFKIRTGRRAFRIRVMSKGSLVREYKLYYDPDGTEILDPSAEGAILLAFSLLTKVTQFDNSGGDQNYHPPIRFGYTRLHTKDRDNLPVGNFPGSEDVDLNGNGIEDGPGVHQMADAPNVNFQVGKADFLDVNGDALPDIIHTLDGQHYYYLNLGNDSFTDRQSMGSYPTLSLDSDKTTLADLDGDGLTDLVNMAASDLMVFYRNMGNGSWAGGVQYNTSPPPFDLNDPDTRLFDANFDKKIDVVRSNSGNDWMFCFNKGNTEGGDWQCTGSVSMGFPPQIVFNNPSVRLADMNGDRLQDVVWIRQLSSTETVVWFWPNKGKAEFDTYVVMTGEVALGPISIEDAKLADVNADGLSDLLKIQSGQVMVWINLGNGSWSEQQVYSGTPAYDRTETALRFADMNGNGTTDLVWIKAVSSLEERFQYLDFCGQTRANQLKIIDNGLGRRINIQYKSSTNYYVEAREAGNPWQIHSRVPVPVVGRVFTTSGLDLDGISGKDEYITEYSFRDAYYDGFEKEFRGFAFVKKIDWGDESAPTQVTRIFFHTGGPDGINNDGDNEVDERTEKGGAEEEPLKGIILKQEVTTSKGGADTCIRDGEEAVDSVVFTRIYNDWTIRRLHNQDCGTRGIATMDEREVSFCYNQQGDTHFIEMGSDAVRHSRNTFSYDDFGNVIEEKNYGALSIVGDEVFTYTQYINDIDKWILGKPLKQYTTDGIDQKVSEEKNYYDGTSYVGLGYGLLEKGNLTRQEGWVSESTYVNLMRNAYGPYGNITGIMDGNGNLREIEYDAAFHTFPVRETIHVGAESPDLIVTAEYNAGLGVITQSTDFNGHATNYDYDSFGRLVNIIRPGDTFEFPTQSFIYTMADPERGLIYSYDKDGNLTLINSTVKVSSVKTKIREKFGKSGTFDTIQYTDGLGRKLALVEESEEGFVVKEAVLFNARGTNRYTFLPYEAVSSDYQMPALSNHNVETHYDATGREILRINPPDQNGTVTQASTQYLPLKNIATDENNNSKTFIHDGLERLIEVHEENKGETYITHYQYDPLGSLTKITDAQNNVKTMTYDGLKQKTEMDDPDCGHKSYEYDDAGNLIKTIDNKSQTIQYSYDGANRILTEDYLDEAGRTPDVAYHYDIPSADYPDAANLKGAFSWIEDLSGAQFFSYDERGNTQWTIKRVDNGIFSNDYKTAMTYDTMDRVVAMTYPDGDHVEYGYNNRTLLNYIPGFVDKMDYHPSGQIASIDYANGVTTSYFYDPRQRLSDLNTKTFNGSELIQELSYTMDGVSNITAITDKKPVPVDSPQNATQTFGYDDLYRLTHAEGPGYGAIDFQYDKIGNMTHKKSPDAPDPKHIDDSLINLGTMYYGGSEGTNNRAGRMPGDPAGPHAVTGTESGLEYEYDDNGNMISHAKGDIYSWNFRDRLVRVQKGETNTRYAYDYGGQRVLKKVDEGEKEKTTYYISEGYEIREGKPIKYVFAGSIRIARVEGRLPDTEESTYQTLNFQPGWNFFSLEVEPKNTAIEEVLGSIEGDFSEVWTFDALQNEYKGYVPGEGVDDLTEIHAQKGYLVNIVFPTTLLVSGVRNTQDVNMASGWNLVGCPANADLLIEEALATIDGKFVSVWHYEAVDGQWRHFDPKKPVFLNDLLSMEPGKAYWVEMKTNGWLAYVKKPPTVYFYHPDHLGSSHTVTNMDGAVVESTEFYPFGMPRYEERNDFDSTYKYTGKELDKESGLMYYRARYYDGVAGRFVSVDPLYVEVDGVDDYICEKFVLNPQQANIYSYAQNSPINFVDPLGLDVISVVRHIGIGVLGQACQDFCSAKGMSNWQSYVAQGAGGIVSAFIPDPFTSGFVGGATTELTSQLLKNMSTDVIEVARYTINGRFYSNLNVGSKELNNINAVDILKSGVEGMVFSKFGDYSSPFQGVISGLTEYMQKNVSIDVKPAMGKVQEGLTNFMNGLGQFMNKEIIGDPPILGTRPIETS